MHNAENKKIKNASPLEYDGISFKSKLEKMIYQILKENGFPVEYEPHKFVIWEGFRPTIPFYNKDKKLNFHRGNAVKYIARAGKKNPEKEVEDLKKAAWYINREIERLENEQCEEILKHFKEEKQE